VTSSPALGIPVVSAAEIDAALSRRDAVEAIVSALHAGWDVEHDHDRLFAPLAGGEFLLMPAESAASAGIKVATIAPGNTQRGLPKIHAWYLLFDRETLEPRAVLEGARLTTLRTPAVTTVAIEGLVAAHPDGARTSIARLAVVGSGPQAVEHVLTLIDRIPVGRVSILGRTPDRIDGAVAALRAAGVAAEPSDDAGGYLCNECFYRLVARASPPASAGFVHVPAIGAPNPLGGTYDLETLRRAVRLVVERTVAHASSPRP